MGLKKAESAGRPGDPAPILSIRSSNGRLNKSGTETYYDGEDYVEIYYDDDKDKLGFSFTDSKDKSNGKVHRDSSNICFPVGSGLNGLGIIYSDIEETWKFEINVDNQFGIPMVDVSDLVEEYGD